MTAIFALLLTAGVQAKTFDACGVTFSYPASWFARADPGDVTDTRLFPKQKVRCAIGLRPPGWIRRNDASPIDLGNWAVKILLIDAPFDAAARERGFVRGAKEGLEPGQWGIITRQSTQHADHFRTKWCEALRGKSWWHERGRRGEIVSPTSKDAVLSRGGHSALIDSADDEEFSAVISQIIETFRFKH